MTVLTSVVMKGNEKVDTIVVGLTTVSIVEGPTSGVRPSDGVTVGTFELLNVGDVYESSRPDVMVTVVVCPLDRLLGVVESVLWPPREAPVPVLESEGAVVKKVTIEVPIVPVALVVRPGSPSFWEVSKLAGELGIVSEVERSEPGLITVGEFVKGGTGC